MAKVAESKAVGWDWGICVLLKDILSPGYNGVNKLQRDMQSNFVILYNECQQGEKGGMRRTCRIRASRSDDSACSMVLYDLLASAFCRIRICSTLPSDPNAISAAQHPDGQPSGSR
jgi:hypothetical protein